MEERKFDDLKTLINHQKAKHSKYDAFFFELRSLAAWSIGSCVGDAARAYTLEHGKRYLQSIKPVHT